MDFGSGLRWYLPSLPCQHIAQLKLASLLPLVSPNPHRANRMFEPLYTYAWHTLLSAGCRGDSGERRLVVDVGANVSQPALLICRSSAVSTCTAGPNAWLRCKPTSISLQVRAGLPTPPNTWHPWCPCCAVWLLLAAGGQHGLPGGGLGARSFLRRLLQVRPAAQQPDAPGAGGQALAFGCLMLGCL